MSAEDQTKADLEAAMEKARAVKEAFEAELMSKANVVGLGIGLLEQSGRRGPTVALVVMVRKKMPPAQLAADDLLPREIEGVPVDVREVGEIQAQA